MRRREIVFMVAAAMLSACGGGESDHKIEPGGTNQAKSADVIGLRKITSAAATIFQSDEDTQAFNNDPQKYFTDRGVGSDILEEYKSIVEALKYAVNEDTLKAIEIGDFNYIINVSKGQGFNAIQVETSSRLLNIPPLLSSPENFTKADFASRIAALISSEISDLRGNNLGGALLISMAVCVKMLDANSHYSELIK